MRKPTQAYRFILIIIGALLMAGFPITFGPLNSPQLITVIFPTTTVSQTDVPCATPGQQNCISTTSTTSTTSASSVTTATRTIIVTTTTTKGTDSGGFTIYASQFVGLVFLALGLYPTRQIKRK